MKKEELFVKHNINETHNKWESTDSWAAVELYRVMHDGKLPPENDKEVKWITDFLDKVIVDIEFTKKLMKCKDFGSLYLTAKRMVYKLSAEIEI